MSAPVTCSDVLNKLQCVEMAEHIQVFGSCATNKENPVDVDIWLDLRDECLTDFRSRKGFDRVRDVLAIAQKHPGMLDPFIRFRDDVLVVRNDDATGWTMAKNAREIVRSMDQSSCSVEQALAWRLQSPSQAEANDFLVTTIRNRLGTCHLFGMNPKDEWVMVHECKQALSLGAQLGALLPEQRQALFHAAIWHSDEKLVADLIEVGVDVNLFFKGEGPVHCLSRDFNKAIFDRLLLAGADVHRSSDAGSTLLHLLCEHKEQVPNVSESVRCVVASGAEVNVLNAQQKSPLHLATEAGNWEVCNALIQLGASVQTHAPDAIPLTFVAAGKGHTAIAMELIKAGADPQEKHGGKSIWGHAGMRRHNETAQTLRHFCASIQALRAMNDMTPSVALAP